MRYICKYFGDKNTSPIWKVEWKIVCLRVVPLSLSLSCVMRLVRPAWHNMAARGSGGEKHAAILCCTRRTKRIMHDRLSERGATRSLNGKRPWVTSDRWRDSPHKLLSASFYENKEFQIRSTVIQGFFHIPLVHRIICDTNKTVIKQCFNLKLPWSVEKKP